MTTRVRIVIGSQLSSGHDDSVSDPMSVFAAFLQRFSQTIVTRWQLGSELSSGHNCHRVIIGSQLSTMTVSVTRWVFLLRFCSALARQLWPDDNSGQNCHRVTIVIGSSSGHNCHRDPNDDNCDPMTIVTRVIIGSQPVTIATRWQLWSDDNCDPMTTRVRIVIGPQWVWPAVFNPHCKNTAKTLLKHR